MTSKKLFTNDLANMRVKLFTHNDMDGRGCEVVMRLAYPNADVTIVKNPKDASEKVAEFIEKGGHHYFDTIFITDISVSEEVAEKIDELNLGNFVLLDHHRTAEYLNKYNWASVQVAMNDGTPCKNSGTNMLFEYLAMKGFFIKESYKDALTVFVEKIRRYDTWEWKDIFNDKEAGALNNLMYLIGTNEWTERYIERFETLEIFAVREGSWVQMFDELDKKIIELDAKSKEYYINRKDMQMTVRNALGYKFGLVYSEQYTSELGNALSERHPELDFIAMVDMGGLKVSLRTTRNDIKLGQDVSSKFGGGGHDKAAGFEFKSAALDSAFRKVFNIPEVKKVEKPKTKLSKVIDFLTGN